MEKILIPPFNTTHITLIWYLPLHIYNKGEYTIHDNGILVKIIFHLFNLYVFLNMCQLINYVNSRGIDGVHDVVYIK